MSLHTIQTFPNMSGWQISCSAMPFGIALALQQKLPTLVVMLHQIASSSEHFYLLLYFLFVFVFLCSRFVFVSFYVFVFDCQGCAQTAKVSNIVLSVLVSASLSVIWTK